MVFFHYNLFFIFEIGDFEFKGKPTSNFHIENEESFIRFQIL
ncbi:hypothetical protein LEP1GSC062_2358 [Leptospira alexanderi serovar Manhao 3 str. L 60]|uniref:Uncharacterized protein n=1 Tax=Leptospira alexanderi serovar Manhao 3 str. L 60 TaxID=1049759 RepID=V6IGC5_9LEPT|nr:hypothetical protein LEP1GSC062_2358 [Leptospira alexanderi serovar Manhao 3 str. L 60]